jgi:hypothetical protein
MLSGVAAIAGGSFTFMLMTFGEFPGWYESHTHTNSTPGTLRRLFEVPSRLTACLTACSLPVYVLSNLSKTIQAVDKCKLCAMGPVAEFERV